MKELFNDAGCFKKILPDGSESDWKSVDIPHDWQIYDVSNLYESAEGGIVRNLFMTIRKMSVFS